MQIAAKKRELRQESHERHDEISARLDDHDRRLELIRTEVQDLRIGFTEARS